MQYQARIVDSELKTLMKSSGAVLIEGPKAVGKTQSASRLAKSHIYLDTDIGAQATAKIDPSLILIGSPPLLIDEWQIVPELWNHVRREIDQRESFGQFILTGSATPADDVTRHSGAGRFSRLRMRPMTLYEMGQSTGDISLEKLFNGGEPKAVDSGMTLINLIDRICIGGWPKFVTLEINEARNAMKSYLNEIIRTDIPMLSGKIHDPVKLERTIQSLARNIGTPVKVETIARDTGGSEAQIDRLTITRYLETLEQLMIIEDLPAWRPELRSRATLRSAPTRHFVDPSLAIAALKASPGQLIKDPNFLGFLFESLVIRDLRVFMQHIGGKLSHYRDSEDLEIDVILESDDDKWAAIEIKLGTGRVDEAAVNLLKFASKVNTNIHGSPTFLAVITGTGFGYRRSDGVFVIPIGNLKP